MRFICAQPANLYYAWQVEVMLNNFLEVGINLNQVDIVCNAENVPKEWSALANNYAARFFFYPDTRLSRRYVSSIRPNILKQHFIARPELRNETILYHDCDILFTRRINWSQFEKDDVWYGSDTKWYIAYDYIISKGQDVFDKMVELTGIDPQLVIDNNDNSIGAQYILKNIDYTYWQEVEDDSERLFKEISYLNSQKKKADPKHHELQIWCADMWAVLWNGWKRGRVTKCHNDLQFSWATSTEEEYYNYPIMHNAGVTDVKSGLFYKAAYFSKLPYHQNLQIKDNTASKKYYDWIQKVEKKTVL
jgi:hypothetical protein